MIEVQLPDGRVVEVDAPDAATAATAARRFLVNSQPQTPQEGGIGSDHSDVPWQGVPQRGNLNVGVQGAGKGVAELVGGIPDLVNTGVNLGIAGLDKGSQALGGPSIDYRFPMASEEIAKTGTQLGEKVGVTTTDPAAMSTPEKLAYNVNRFGTQVAGAVPALSRVAATRTAEIAGGDALPKFYDSLVKPYGDGASARTVIGDAAGAAGAGTGVTAAQTYAPDSPLADFGGAVGGGVGGITALGLVEGLGRMMMMLGRRVIGGTTARDIPLDPQTGASTSEKGAKEASRIVQNAAINPEKAAARIEPNQAEVGSDLGRLMSSAALTEDPGLAVLERNVDLGNPAAKIDRAQKFQTGVRNTIDQVAPEGATSEPLINKAQSEIDARRATAQDRVDQAQTYVDRTAQVRADQGAEVEGYRGQGPAASQALDQEIVNRSLNPMTEMKTRRYEAIPDTPLPGENFHQEASQIRAGAESLPPNARANVLPERQLGDFESLAIRDPETGNITGFNPISSADAERIRPQLSAEIQRARKENASPEYIDNLNSLKSRINEETANIPQAAEANRFFNEDFAPVYGKESGEAYNFRQDVNKDKLSRTASPPTETAGRFLQPGADEKTQALTRIFDTIPDPTQAQAAARQYLMSDLAGKNVVNAGSNELRPQALIKWRANNANTLDTVPGLRDEVDGLIGQAQKGERIGGKFAQELKDARTNQKTTEKQINSSALSDVVGADADKTVASIMSNKNSSGKRLGELIELTKDDEAARNGLKAAVRDYLVDKATTTASEKLVPGDRRGPVSSAKLSNIFNEHEQELAQIFSPDEMNTLRAGNRALELSNVDRLRASTGSDTAEKTNIVDRLANTSLGKGLEAFARLHYGLLKAGGIKATARRISEGIGSTENDEITRLVQRATVDPELMGLLLGRDVPVNSPRWNAKLNKLIGATEFGRQEYGDQQ